MVETGPAAWQGQPKRKGRRQGRTLASGRGIWPNPQTGVLPGGGGGGRWLLRPAAAAAAAPLRGRRSAAVLKRRAGRKASALYPPLGHRLPRDGHFGLHRAPGDTGAPLQRTSATPLRRTSCDQLLLGRKRPSLPSRKAEVTGAHSPASAPSYSVPRRRCSVATRQCACCSQDSRYLSPCAKPAPREGRSA